MTGSITGPDHGLSARSVLSWDRCWWIFPSGFYLLLSSLIETCNSSGAIITLMLKFLCLHIEIAPSVLLQYLTPAGAPIFPFLTNELRALLWPVSINHGERGRQWITAPVKGMKWKFTIQVTSGLLFVRENQIKQQHKWSSMLRNDCFWSTYGKSSNQSGTTLIVLSV